MNFQQEATKIYTVRVKSTGQEITFGVSTGEDPPPKIRLYHENKSIAVFIYSKQEDSYSELPAEKLDKFDLELMSKECSANRIRGDERSVKIKLENFFSIYVVVINKEVFCILFEKVMCNCFHFG